MKKIITAFFFISSIYACNSAQKTASSSPEAMAEKAKENTEANSMLQAGIDFFGTGNTPVNWRLEMSDADTVRFTADDGLTLKFGYNRLKKDISADKSVFTLDNNNIGKISILMVQGQCTVTSIRQAFSKLVTFTYNGKAYTGCGRFLADNTLSNKWILEKIGNTMINTADYNHPPTMQFDLAKQELRADDGCNAVGGKIEVQGNRIKFSALISTQMACGKKNIGDIFSSQISDKSVDYYFKNGELYLYLPDDSMLIFRKA